MLDTPQELEWSFRLFNEMRERGTVPNGVTCSALMDACLKADELGLAFAVLEHMLDIGIEPTEVVVCGTLRRAAAQFRLQSFRFVPGAGILLFQF